MRTGTATAAPVEKPPVTPSTTSTVGMKLSTTPSPPGVSGSVVSTDDPSARNTAAAGPIFPGESRLSAARMPIVVCNPAITSKTVSGGAAIVWVIGPSWRTRPSFPRWQMRHRRAAAS